MIRFSRIDTLFAALTVFVPITSLIAAPGDVAPGLRFYGPSGSTDTVFVDNQGQVVHKVPSAFEPGVGVYLLEDGSILRAIRTGNGPQIGGVGGGIQRLTFDGTVLWDWRFDGPGFVTHHSLWPMPNRNVLAIVWQDKTIPETIGKGRDPATLTGFNTFLPDYIIEVKPTGPTTGEIVWEWHAWDHLVQDFDPTKPNFGVVKDHPELIDINYPAVIPPAAAAPTYADWIHSNAVAYDIANDWVIVNTPNFNEFWIIDHSTTTAEAAGHTGGKHGKGGDLLYRWGNPQAYKAGTEADRKLFFQHGAHTIQAGYPGEGNILLFNNNFGGTFSSVDELVLPIDASGGFTLEPNGTYGPSGPIWQYTAPTVFWSKFISSAVRLPNGNTLIDSGAQNWIFEVKPDLTKVWEYTNTIPVTGGLVFRADYTERSLWSSDDRMSTTDGGVVDFNIVAGSFYAGKSYFVLGSISGTSPGFNLQGKHIPLNVDPYLLFTAANPGTALLPGTIGVLNSLGNATGQLVLPPGAASALTGVKMHHAYVVFDSGTSQVLHASNAVSLQLHH